MKESTIKEILTSYERKRDLAERELDARKKKVYSRIPEVKEIDEEVAKIGLKLAKLVLLNPQNKDSILEETRFQMDKLKKRKGQLLNDFKVPEGYLKLKHECSICKDTGFLKNGKKCNCLKQEIINNAYSMSNLSRILNTQNFSTFDASKFSIERDDQIGVSPQENILEILSICEGFVMNFDKDNDENIMDTELDLAGYCLLDLANRIKRNQAPIDWLNKHLRDASSDKNTVAIPSNLDNELKVAPPSKKQ